jgi:putative oxidoreductase
MFAYLRKPHVDLAAVILRLGVGFLFIAHGYMKLFQQLSWSDILTPTMQQVVGWTEFICGILFVVGLLSRLAALGLIADMVGAIALVTGKRDFIAVNVGPHGFTFAASGFEYNVILIAACLAVIMLGSGWFSLDHLIFNRNKNERLAAMPTGTPHLQPQDRISSAV